MKHYPDRFIFKKGMLNMKKLTLLKPWQMPIVRLKIGDARSTVPDVSDAGIREPVAAHSDPIIAERVLSSTPWEAPCRRAAPRGRAIFASTVAPHKGCPHLFL